MITKLKKKKNKNPPELPENQTAWKSDSKRVKETFIHPGRRGRNRQLDGEDRRHTAGEAGAG